MSDIDILVRGGVMIVLLSLSGIFSGSETALTSITAAKIRQLKDHDEKSAKVLKKIKKQLNKILTTILIGNNIVNIAATAILTQLTSEIFTGSGGSATLIATGIMTILILIFGEITPKTFAAQNPEKIAVKVSNPLLFLSKILRPIIFILTKITGFVIKILGGDVGENSPFVTEEEIRSMVDVGEEEGVLRHQEKEMIEGIFDIDDTDVADVMVPRIDIVASSEDEPIKKVLDMIITYGHSRIPVFKDTIDNITGIVYAKDILPFVSSSGTEIEEKTISGLMRKAYYVPETKKVSHLLRELQQKKIHMAIVLDEYGGTEGLVTIEDILEEIVGDILDEYDNEIDMIEKIEENKYLIKAEVSLEEINEIFDIDLPEDDFDSLGGYIFSFLGRVPVQGDMIEIEDLSMTVVKLHNRRIKQIEVKINQQKD
ncbi:hemolysin family protein [Sporosalibacterium faouarense]|uniref:hemolysin family protein n=1 Tax=Sporosalibacterium faouarense TaxID=516123 RepID=UPI00141D509D|nr:hemolysin family protein [Sporosalibacterium faouarense]MTI49414.1 HlyC/CorC family transporter [Bacillota bacterium]